MFGHETNIFTDKENMHTIYFLNKDTLVTEIHYSFKTRKIYIQNYISDILILPFGIVTEPSFERFENFLESRCFPRTRYNVDHLLELLGLTNYDPISIIRKTHGVQNEDTCWIRFEGEKFKYDEIKLRD